MIYFFHHYELPVILQQAHTQDLLMRNQEGGGPPLIVAYEQGGHGTIGINRRINRNRDAATNNNNNNNAVNNNNAGNVNVNRRMTGFNFGPFRFRLGVVLTTHQRNEGGGNQQPPDSPQNNHGHSHENSNHGRSQGRSSHGHSHGPSNHGHSHGHSHGHQHIHVHQHGHQHLHSHGHSHNREESRTETEEETTGDQIVVPAATEAQADMNSNGFTSNVETSQNVNTVSSGNSSNLSSVIDCHETQSTESSSNSSSGNCLPESEQCVDPSGSITKNNVPNNCAEEKIKNKDSENDLSSDKCDISQCSNVIRDESPNHGNASQYDKENTDINNDNNPLPNEELDEITDDLRQISAALKTTLPTDDNSRI